MQGERKGRAGNDEKFGWSRKKAGIRIRNEDIGNSATRKGGERDRGGKTLPPTA